MESPSAIVDSGLSKIRLFLLRDLVVSLQGQNGNFEPQRDWATIVENVMMIRAVDHHLPTDQKTALDDLVSSLQRNLNGVVSVLRDAVSKGVSQLADNPEIESALNYSLLKVHEDFERAARAFYELKPANNQSSITQFFAGGFQMNSEKYEIHDASGQIGSIGRNAHTEGSTFHSIGKRWGQRLI